MASARAAEDCPGRRRRIGRPPAPARRPAVAFIVVGSVRHRQWQQAPHTARIRSNYTSFPRCLLQPMRIQDLCCTASPPDCQANAPPDPARDAEPARLQCHDDEPAAHQLSAQNGELAAPRRALPFSFRKKGGARRFLFAPVRASTNTSVLRSELTPHVLPTCTVYSPSSSTRTRWRGPA